MTQISIRQAGPLYRHTSTSSISSPVCVCVVHRSPPKGKFLFIAAQMFRHLLELDSGLPGFLRQYQRPCERERNLQQTGAPESEHCKGFSTIRVAALAPPTPIPYSTHIQVIHHQTTTSQTSNGMKHRPRFLLSVSIPHLSFTFLLYK